LRDNTSSLQSALANLELLQNVREQLTKFLPQSLQKRIESNPHDPDLDNRMEDVSILFLDMAGYTRMSEHLSADELNTVVETYFSSFLDDIRRNGGEINGVAGDGLMIVFQDADRSEHARRAVSTALAIKRKAAEINAAEHAGWPAVVINMGINSGEALIGASKIQGATAMLFVYTVTGYVANLAARVGAFARDGAILVSEETALRLGQEFNLESMGPQAFKNISRPIEVFRVADEASERGR
jgi:class 3 adenylate cyclase